jgi:hypothetical protein
MIGFWQPAPKVGTKAGGSCDCTAIKGHHEQILDVKDAGRTKSKTCHGLQTTSRKQSVEVQFTLRYRDRRRGTRMVASMSFTHGFK